MMLAFEISADLGAVLIGIVGFGFGLYEYFIAQKWKKSEFAAQQLEKLLIDTELALCCTFLDWSKRRILVPEKYKALTAEASFIHDWALMEKALAPETDVSKFGWQEVMYRDLFDRFFTYLDQINHFIEIKLFTANDVYSLEYWVNEVRTPRYGNGRRVFHAFIQSYGYSGVFALATRFDHLGKKQAVVTPSISKISNQTE